MSLLTVWSGGSKSVISLGLCPIFWTVILGLLTNNNYIQYFCVKWTIIQLKDLHLKLFRSAFLSYLGYVMQAVDDAPLHIAY